MKAGIQTRLLLLTTVVLGTFLSLAGVVLDRSFSASVTSGAEEQLRLVIYSLMGAVQEDGTGVRFVDELPEPRLHQPESGLYAAVFTADNRPDWRSPSVVTTGVNFPSAEGLSPGEFSFVELNGSRTNRFFLSYAVIWEDSTESVLTFTVGTDQGPFQRSITGFRRNLYLGLGAVIVLFVIAQYLAVRLGLRPLRVMAHEIQELEEGQRDKLSSDYPIELHGLVENLDRFIAHEQRSRTRYRKAMEDLAHSLKTPLAVIRNALSISKKRDASADACVVNPIETADRGASDGARDGDQSRLLAEQLDRMESTVTHQLSRAAVSGPVVLGQMVNVSAVVNRLLRALQSAYVERGIVTEQTLPGDLQVRVDERDLLEMLGNLLENAFKYTGSRIRVSGSRDSQVEICIEDDGPGIDPEVRDEVLNRGTRADQVQPGQGIGLAVVQELIGAYRGELRSTQFKA